MAFEQFRTQVLLLHSQQGTLDRLSAGFNDKYSVHCATSGSEALNLFGETPIHIIVSAQDLPGMSGLEALREAKKRSPDTIGILLAGPDKSDDLEALVGDKEVFQIVRGQVTPESILELVESATKQARLLALGESANDQASNFDEPVTEEIVMETSENGSLIISDGTGRMPALQPHKIDFGTDAGAREVDLLVMTRDEEFLATIRDSARGLHHLHHAITPTQAEDFVSNNAVGVLITDAAMVGSDIEKLTDKLRRERPRLVAIVAGRRDDGEMLMDLINRGHVYRFLLKPVSPGRARLAIEASVKHHIEAPDAAFKAKPATQSAIKSLTKQRPVAKAKPVVKPKPAAKSPTEPLAKAKPAAKKVTIPVLLPEQKTPAKPVPQAPKPAQKMPKPAPKPVQQKAPKPEPKPRPKSAPVTPKHAAPKPRPKPAPPPEVPKKAKDALRIEPTISATPVTDKLYDALDAKRKSIAATVDKTLASAGSLASGAQGAMQASSEAVAGAIAPLRKPRALGKAAAVIAVVGATAWIVSNWESIAPTVSVPQTDTTTDTVAETQSVPTIVESDISVPLPVQEPAAEPETPVYQALLEEARTASDAGNFIRPEGENAVELYLAVLEEAPDDPDINAELEYVVDQVLRLAETAILEQNIENASDALAMARLANPANPRLDFLDAQLKQIQYRATVDEARLAIRDGLFEDAGQLISEARYLAGQNTEEINLLTQELAAARSQQKVEKVLTLAAEHLEAGNLITPSNNNARYYYELALSNDPGNQAAEQGLIIVASKLVLRAREAIDQDRLDDADELLDDARALDPDSTELAASTKALDSALEAKAEAERQAEAARLAELARQAELERQAELARQAELRRQAELERQAELARQAELERQAEAARLAEIKRQQEEARQARLREAQQRNAEQDAAVAATTSMLGVGGSTVKEPSANTAPKTTAVRNNRDQAPQAVAARAPEPTQAVVEREEIPTATLPLRAGATGGEATLAPAGSSQGFSPSDYVAGALASRQASATTVPISSLTRTNYVAPEYPRAAQRRNLSGSVDVMFTVTTIGTVSDVTVVKSEPDDTFNKAAIDAVSKWRFEPIIENGVALEKRSAVRLSFDLQ